MDLPNNDVAIIENMIWNAVEDPLPDRRVVVAPIHLIDHETGEADDGVLVGRTGTRRYLAVLAQLTFTVVHGEVLDRPDLVVERRPVGG